MVEQTKTKKYWKTIQSFWDKIKYLVNRINGGKPGEIMKTKFNSDDNLPLNKIPKLRNLTIVVRSAFEEDDK